MGGVVPAPEYESISPESLLRVALCSFARPGLLVSRRT